MQRIVQLDNEATLLRRALQEADGDAAAEELLCEALVRVKEERRALAKCVCAAARPRPALPTRRREGTTHLPDARQLARRVLGQVHASSPDAAEVVDRDMVRLARAMSELPHTTPEWGELHQAYLKSRAEREAIDGVLVDGTRPTRAASAPLLPAIDLARRINSDALHV